MSVFQGTNGGGGVSISVPNQTEAMALDMEAMSEEERTAYLTQKLGSAEAAAAYTRAMIGADDLSVVGEEVGELDQTSQVVGCNEFTDSTPVSTRISHYYTLAALSNQTAYTKYNIVPHQGLSKAQIMCNLKHLAVNSLDPIREWNTKVKIGSGFRSNSSTDHGRGSAADLYFYTPGSTTRLPIAQMVPIMRAIIYDLKVPFTQLLLESSGNGVGWIHIANRKSGQNSAMRVGYSLNNGGTYHAGIPKL